MSSILQSELEPLLVLHDRFLRSLSAAKRLDLGMQTAKDLVFSGHNITEADLVGAILDGSKFVKSIIQRANFFGARMQRCDFQDADLTQSDLRGAYMRATIFTNAILTEANFGEGSLLRRDRKGNIAPVHDVGAAGDRMADVTFRNAIAQHARFSSALTFSTDLSFADFRYAKLSGVNFMGSNLRGVSFYQADLTGCNFRNTNMNSAILSGAMIDGADFEGADLTASILDSEHYGRQVFSKAKLPRNLEQLDQNIQDILISHGLWVDSLGRRGKQADLSRVNLTDNKLDGVQLQAANMKFALLQNASMTNSIFSMADLSECNANGATFQKSDCKGCNFSISNMDGANLSFTDCSPMAIMTGYSESHPISWPTNFSESSLRNAQMEGSNLRLANLQGALLNKADLRDANLTDANLVDADLTGADLRGAILDRADLRGAIGVVL